MSLKALTLNLEVGQEIMIGSNNNKATITKIECTIEYYRNHALSARSLVSARLLALGKISSNAPHGAPIGPIRAPR